MVVVEKPEELQELVRSQPRLRVTGGGTKPALSHSANASLAKLSGVRKYNPAEFTFTAMAGTRIDEVETILAERQQYLPFEPPFSASGATLGGTVAAGLSGSGRLRFGGVRDFLLGAKIVTGEGISVATGSQVVKNAAGFDLPKLMVGGQGCYGVMTELTFKVFPKPQHSATVVFEAETVGQAVALLRKLAGSGLDLAALDLDADNRLWARVCGFRSAVLRRTERVRQSAPTPGRILTDDEDAQFWNDCQEFRWLPDGRDLVKVAITPKCIEKLALLLPHVARRFSVGGNLAWIGWPTGENPAQLRHVLCELECPGLFVTGTPSTPYVGPRVDNLFAQRLRAAIDPHGKFAVS